MDLKTLEWTLKSLVMSTRATLRYRTPWPRLIKPVGGISDIAINPHDKRARKKLIFDSLRGRMPRNRAFWKQACEELRPDAALDIGVNFGECLFTPDYAAHTRVYGFEANPELQPYLNESHGIHPHRECITLVAGIAGSRHGGEAEFHIDTQWSGMSGAVRAIDNAQRYRTINLPTVSVDGVLGEFNCSPARLLFKIDVEGYEQRVLAGMRETLNQAEWAVGFLEFDELSAVAAGVDLSNFFEELKHQFRVYAFNRQNTLLDMQKETFETLSRIGRKTGPTIRSEPRPLYTDVVLHAGVVTPQIEALIGAWS